MLGLSRRDMLRYGVVLTLSFAMSMVGLLHATAAKKPKHKTASPYAHAMLVDGEPPLPVDGSFTIAVLPDTQFYSESYPEQFLAQTDWIVKNCKKRNIACVLGLGDLVNKNTDEQWKVAQKAMNQLDGHVPYFVAVGNHDYDAGSGIKNRSTKFSEYFPVAKFRNQPTFGGTYDREPKRMENAYYLFSAGGRDFVVIVLEYSLRNDVVRWANEVAAKYSNREAILVTHAYLIPSRKTRSKEGEKLWRNLVSKQNNFIFTINGHNGISNRLVSSTPAGRDVPQMVVDYQGMPQGGDGWLRLMEFHADKQTVSVVDYSPTRKQCNESPQTKFTIKTAPIRLSGQVASVAVAADKPTSKIPQPGLSAIATARPLVRNIYRAAIDQAKKPADKAKLANDLMDAAAKTIDDEASRFVLLTMARDFAIDAKSRKTAVDATVALADRYQTAPGEPTDAQEQFAKAQRFWKEAEAEWKLTSSSLDREKERLRLEIKAIEWYARAKAETTGAMKQQCEMRIEEAAKE